MRQHYTPQPVDALASTLRRLRLNIAEPQDQPIIACGVAHTLILTSTGQLLAWGCGKYGQLGYGNLWDREEAVVVPTLRTVVAFSAGDRHTIAAQASVKKRVSLRSLVKSKKTTSSPSSLTVSAKKDQLSSWQKVGTPIADGKIFMWGLNLCGELGLGDKNIRLQPAQICTLRTNSWECAAGARHSLVISSCEIPRRSASFPVGIRVTDKGMRG